MLCHICISTDVSMTLDPSQLLDCATLADDLGIPTGDLVPAIIVIIVFFPCRTCPS